MCGIGSKDWVAADFAHGLGLLDDNLVLRLYTYCLEEPDSMKAGAPKPIFIRQFHAQPPTGRQNFRARETCSAKPLRERC